MVRRPIQPSFGGAFDVEPNRRMFFAALPDVGAKAQLARLTERLRHDGAMPGRPVDSGRWHITLNILGEFGDQIPSDLAPAALAAAATIKAQPFEIIFDRIVGTGPRLILFASDGSSALHEFRRSLIEALIRAGLRRHVESKFKPHLTLSYDFSDVAEQQIEPVTWTVRKFVLIESLIGKHQHIERGSWSIRP